MIYIKISFHEYWRCIHCGLPHKPDNPKKGYNAFAKYLCEGCSRDAVLDIELQKEVKQQKRFYNIFSRKQRALAAVKKSWAVWEKFDKEQAAKKLRG